MDCLLDYFWIIPTVPSLLQAVVTLATMLLCLGDAMTMTMATTTLSSSLLDTVCSSVSCPNGHCYVVGDRPLCACDLAYTGPQCDVVDLTQLNLIVIGSMVICKWPRPPAHLDNYAFVYHRLTDHATYVYKRTIDILDYESSALVGNLRDGVSTYRVCVELEAVAENAVLTQSMDHVTNCVNVSTQPDYHTMFAWLIAACSCVAAVLLIYWQKDKIELLYFNRAVTINNGIYNYNVAELIRLEKIRKDREKEYSLIQRIEEGRLNKMPLETIQDEQ